MKKVFFDVDRLDRNCIENFGIPESILMENAASKVETEIRKKVKQGSKILFLLGSGNNAADAVCVARKLSKDYECFLFFTSKKSNDNLKFQTQIAKKLGVKEIFEILDYDCYVDGIFGSGFKGDLDENLQNLLNLINQKSGLKIAIDIPSGVSKFGIKNVAFKADITICMGALKVALFSDFSKDFVGKIKIANLGLSSKNYEGESNIFLLEKSDLKLPFRVKKNTNKGDFGHVFVICGELKGAAEIAGMAAFSIGAGLVSLICDDYHHFNPILMQKKLLPSDSKFLLCGSGLGKKSANFNEFLGKKCVFDADILSNSDLPKFLDKFEEIVLTPHPKEFAKLLKICQICDLSVDEIQKNRFELALKFSEIYPKVVLVLKGANTIIAKNSLIYIMPFGSNILSKAGSGDVLAGLILGLLAQNYSSLQAAINGTLAHALAVKKFAKNSYSLNPFDIIEGIKCL